MTKFAPAISKPTATLLIDDDLFFVENVKALLPHDTSPSIFRAEDMEALRDVDIFSACGNPIKSAKIDSMTSLKNLFKSDLDLPVSTIVIDQCMEPKEGLEILRSIRSPFVQKILMSNFFSHEDALQALNEGMINAYLCKMDPSFIEKLSKAIYEAQRRFFCGLSLVLPNFLSKDNPLMEKETQLLFTKIKDQFSVKYYEGNSTLRQFSFSNPTKKDDVNLHIIPEEELDEVLQSQQSESASTEILKLIKNGKMLPCFKGNAIPDGENWLEYLRPAQSFQGNKKYVYSIYRENNHESN